MALADITSKILQDAEHEAAQIIADAEKKANAIIVASEEDRLKAVARIEETSRQKNEQITTKVANLARHLRKSKMLEAKRQVLEDVLVRAKEQLIKTDAHQKEALFTAMLKQIDMSSGKIRPVSADKQIVQKAIQNSGKDFTTGEVVSGMGGFVYLSDSVEIDFRIESIVDRELATHLEHELFAILFAQS